MNRAAFCTIPSKNYLAQVRVLAESVRKHHSPDDERGAVAQIFEHYRSALAAAGHDQIRTWPYAFDRFDNDVPFPPGTQRHYRELGERGARFGDPFAASGPDSYYHAIRRPSSRGRP